MRLRLRYTKTGKVRFTGHRDVVRMWERAMRRSGLGVLLVYLSLPVVLAGSRSSTVYAVTSVGVVICLLLRRFEGYHRRSSPQHIEGDDWRRRLLDDWRPGPESVVAEQALNSSS